MGVVYRATELELNRTVALKVIAADLLDDPRARRRFVQESRLAASIDHPNVIPILSAGEDGGVPYIAMRYVAGDDVRTLVRREGPLAPARAARIVAQAGEALDAAHAAGLVHRDVKPANLLLDRDDHVYLSDFGLTRHVWSLSGQTDAGHWVGTLGYVAPEQIRGGQVDARTDVYALGCVLFYMLTGHVPFQRDGDEARLWAHLTERPPRVGPGAPPALDAVVARALAKAPDDRFPSAGDLGRAAVAAAAGVDVRSPERTVASGDAAAAEEPTRTSAPVARRRRRPRITAMLVGTAAAAVILAPTLDQPPPPPVAEAAKPRSSQPRVVARIPVGARPSTLVRAGGRLWVGSFGSSTLTMIDGKSRRRVEVGDGTADAVLARGRLWVATRAPQIVRLDPVSGRPAGAPIALPLTPVAMAARGGDVVVGVETDVDGVLSAQLLRLDASTGAVEAAADVSHGMSAAVYVRGWLWTLHGDPSFIVRRHPVTLTARQRIPLPGTAVGALAYGAGALWVTIPEQDQLVRYGLRSKRRHVVEVGARPVGVAVRKGRVWVAASDSSTLDRVDAGTLRPAGPPVRTPFNPYTLAADRDGLWVTCVGDDVVARVKS